MNSQVIRDLISVLLTTVKCKIALPFSCLCDRNNPFISISKLGAGGNRLNRFLCDRINYLLFLELSSFNFCIFNS
jgi:hypothetical protein